MDNLYIILALLTSFFFGLSIFLDKRWVMPKISSDLFIGASAGILAPIYFIPLYFTKYVTTIDLIPFIYTVISGSLYTIPLVFYILALRRDDPAVVTPMFRLTPIFTVILAALLLGQIVSLEMYIGCLIVLIGVLLVVINKDTITKFSISPALSYVVVATLLFAIGNIFIELSLETMNIWTFLFYSRTIAIIPSIAILMLPEPRNFIKKLINNPIEHGLIQIFVSKSIEIVGSILYSSAVFLGPVSVVSTITSMETVFVMIFAIVYSYTKSTKMPIRTLIRQSLASVIVIIGVAIIYL